MTTRFIGHLLTGDHASRPDATAVPEGTLYSCTTHSLVYQSNLVSWSTWLTAGGTISAGSNSTRVREVSTAGASSTLWSPFDHAHDGIGTITASSSNTMQRGTFNMRSGNGVSFGLTDTDGDGELDTMTINATAVSSGGGGGSSLAQSYLGYNTIGGTEETSTLNRFIGKTFTPAANGILLAIEVYTREVADGLQTFAAAVCDDNAGAIGKILGVGWGPNIALTNNATFGDGSTTSIGRWLSIPMTKVLTGGTAYWGGIFIYSSSANTRLFYDSSGTDRRYDSGGAFMADGGRYSQTDTTRKYSIRFVYLS